MITEDEYNQMMRELNEALNIEPEASHTQRLVTIVRLRSQALRQEETALELDKAIGEREKAEEELLSIAEKHANFISGTISHAEWLKKVSEEFRHRVLSRLTEEAADELSVALASFRERKDDGQRFSIDEVAEEMTQDRHPDDMRGYNPTYIREAVDEGLAPLRAKLHGDEESDFPTRATDVNPEVTDPLDLAETDPKPEVRMDFPGPHDQKIGAETTTDFVDGRNRVPFADADVPLAADTRDWMQDLAAGTAVASGSSHDGD
jgi:hypothetical protein